LHLKTEVSCGPDVKALMVIGTLLPHKKGKHFWGERAREHERERERDSERARERESERAREREKERASESKKSNTKKPKRDPLEPRQF
jgi:cobalamin-dependent methionine synthase I